MTTKMADDNNSGKSSGEVSKKSFEYRVSKKVAELIQVVHMLFTKNHERELELQATKDAYEQEIENIIRDARNRLGQLQQTADDEKRRCDVQAKKIELDFSNKEKLLEQKVTDACRKVKESDERVASISRLNEGLNEQLVQMQTDFEALQKVNEGLNLELQAVNNNNTLSAEKIELSTELSDCRRELEKKAVEIRRLHENAGHVETQKLQYEQLIERLKVDLNRTEAALKKDMENLQRKLAEMAKGKEKLELKNRSLEMHLKKLKESERRSSTPLTGGRESAKLRPLTPDQSTNAMPIKSPTQTNNDMMAPATANGSLSDAREEVERLKREIQRYRMELYNREGNFNRMFTESSPVRLGGGRMANLGVARSKSDVTNRISVGRKQQVHSGPKESRLRSRFGQDRLPALSMDFKQRATTRSLEMERL